MRTTSLMIYNQISLALRKTMEDLSTISNRLSSGKKIAKPSDDVIGTVKSMDYKLSIDMNGQYKSNIANLKARFDYTDRVLSSSADTLKSLKTIAVNGAAGTFTADERTIYSGAVAQYRDTLLSMANGKFEDRYIFSGFKTDTEAFDPATFAYQGDSGKTSVAIDQGTKIGINFPGSDAFSIKLAAPEVIELSDGSFAHYTPGAGTTTNVQIRAADDVTVLDNFSYDNFIQMTDVFSSALNTNSTLRIEALVKPIGDATTHMLNVQADLAVRQNGMADQDKRLSSLNLSLQNSLSETEDADLTETITDLQKTNVALQALQQASARILSQSLLDFLK